MGHFKLRWKVTQKRLHRFAGLIPFCGVAIILATFIVKEVLRDNAKDRVSALEAGQRAYDSALATDSISDQLSQLSTDLTAVRTDQLSQEYPEYQRRDDQKAYRRTALGTYLR